jgi:serpin B
MVRRLLLIFAGVMLPVLACGAKFDAAVATNQFGLDLYRHLAVASPDGNLVISPYSIESALALAYSGADGATRTEMAKALHFPADNMSLQISFHSLRTDLDNLARASVADLVVDRESSGGGEPFELHQANRLFGQQGYDFLPSFLALMKDDFSAPFEPLNFRADAEAARGTINSWVGEQTRQKIRNVIPNGGVNSDTRLVLVNALYLKAPWQKRFGDSETSARPFYVQDSAAVELPTMRQTAYLGYAKEDGFTVVALDYAGGGLQFLILLPDEGTGCDALAAKLTPDHFQEWATVGEKTQPTRIELYLPKFQVEGASLALGVALRSLGIRRAFDQPAGSADFSRIARRQSNDYVALSDVFHKTFIVVDENGTEAAAATAIMLMTLGVEASPPRPIVVRVDRPFLFAIQHRASGACLFLGRITDPR